MLLDITAPAETILMPEEFMGRERGVEMREWSVYK